MWDRADSLLLAMCNYYIFMSNQACPIGALSPDEAARVASGLEARRARTSTAARLLAIIRP